MPEINAPQVPPAAPPKPKLVWVEITRPYPRGGSVHTVGSRIQVPDYALDSIEGARPPFGRRVEGPRK